jgi:hypothetical protein
LAEGRAPITALIAGTLRRPGLVKVDRPEMLDGSAAEPVLEMVEARQAIVLGRLEGGAEERILEEMRQVDARNGV